MDHKATVLKLTRRLITIPSNTKRANDIGNRHADRILKETVPLIADRYEPKVYIEATRLADVLGRAPSISSATFHTLVVSPLLSQLTTQAGITAVHAMLCQQDTALATTLESQNDIVLTIIAMLRSRDRQHSHQSKLPHDPLRLKLADILVKFVKPRNLSSLLHLLR